ncbi:MAG: amidohydrolase [Lautropia sp.]
MTGPDVAPAPGATADGELLPIVDAHHHLWDRAANRYPMLEGPMHDRGWGDWAPLRRNYLVEDLLADAARQRLIKSVHVQANVDRSDPVRETAWLTEVAGRTGFPHAIVAFVDLSADDAAAWLDRHAAFDRVRGIRQVLNRHPDPRHNRAEHDYLADPAWQRGLGLLQRYGFSFDVQVYWPQMDRIAELADRYPQQQFILDHAGMPLERDAAGLDGWRHAMRRLAERPNIVVKLSGYGMTDLDWTVDSLRPFVLEPIQWFGPERAMFGSNFPVDRLMADYDRLWNAYRALIADFSRDQQRALLAGTAERIYRI